ncbi:MAG: hypothetical protein QM500_16360 [Methylococcales bacterium]
MKYDGTTPLQPIVAKLIGCSPKSQGKIAKTIKAAKEALGITSKARVLPPKIRVKVYKWLVSQPCNDKPVEIISQDSKPAASTCQADVKINLQPDTNKPVKIISHPDTKTTNKPVKIVSQINPFDNLQVAFYIVRDGQRIRQGIALDGFFIDALKLLGIEREAVPSWVQSAIDGWTSFDPKLPVTRQIKYLIVQELMTKIDSEKLRKTP